MSVSFYELSSEADQDIEEIYDYAEQQYGTDRAVEYTLDLEFLFERIVQNPELGTKRDEIQSELRSFPKAQHIVFYRILPDRIRIVRVIHGSRDFSRQFG